MTDYRLFERDARRIVKEQDVERVRLALVAQMDAAGLNYLEQGRDAVFELFLAVRKEFDGTDYMQGKKDGLRAALALLGYPEMADFNRGRRMGRP